MYRSQPKTLSVNVPLYLIIIPSPLHPVRSETEEDYNIALHYWSNTMTSCDWNRRSRQKLSESSAWNELRPLCFVASTGIISHRHISCTYDRLALLLFAKSRVVCCLHMSHLSDAAEMFSTCSPEPPFYPPLRGFAWRVGFRLKISRAWGGG